jgi:hypothetical protein
MIGIMVCGYFVLWLLIARLGFVGLKPDLRAFCGLGFDPTCLGTNRRVETRPTGYFVGWVLTQHDWRLTVGLKPDLRGNLWVGF